MKNEIVKIDISKRRIYVKIDSNEEIEKMSDIHRYPIVIYDSKPDTIIGCALIEKDKKSDNLIITIEFSKDDISDTVLKYVSEGVIINVTAFVVNFPEKDYIFVSLNPVRANIGE